MEGCNCHTYYFGHKRHNLQSQHTDYAALRRISVAEVVDWSMAQLPLQSPILRLERALAWDAHPPACSGPDRQALPEDPKEVGRNSSNGQREISKRCGPHLTH